MFSEKELKIIIEAQDKASSAFKKVEERVKSLTQKTFNLLNPFSSLEKAIAVVGGTAGFGMLAKSFLDTASAFEQFNVRLQTVTGSMQAAKAAMGWIQTFTAQTPYELDEVTDAFIKLKNYGIDPTNGTLRILGDTASAMGKSLDDAVEALADAMTGEFERLKEFGIKASATADQVTLRFMKNGKQMAITVKNSAEEIQKALLSIWGDKFAGGMEKMSHTLRGMLSNLSDYWTQFKNEVMASGVYNYIKAVLETLLEKINQLKKNGKLDEWAKKVGEAITSTFEKAAIAIAKLPLVLEETKAALLEFLNVIASHGKLFALLGTVGAVAALRARKPSIAMQLAAGSFAAYKLSGEEGAIKKELEETKKAISELKNTQNVIEKIFADVHKKIAQYQKEQQSATQTTKDFANSQKDLADKTGQATNSISQQINALKSFQEKLKSVMDTIRWQQMTPEERYAEVRNKLDNLFSKALNDDDVEAAKEYVDTFQKYMDLLSQFEGKENILQEFEDRLQDLQQWFGTGELSANVDTSSLESANQIVSNIKDEVQEIKDLLPIEIKVVDKATEAIKQIKKELEGIKEFTITVKVKTEQLSEQIEKAIKRGQLDLSGGQVG